MLKETSHPQPWHHLEKPWCNGGLPASNSHFQQFAFKSYTAQSVVIPKTFSAVSKNELAVIFPCKPSIKSRWCPGSNIYWSLSTQCFLMRSGTTTPRLPFNTMNIMLPHDLATTFDIKALTSVSPVSIDDTVSGAQLTLQERDLFSESQLTIAAIKKKKKKTQKRTLRFLNLICSHSTLFLQSICKLSAGSEAYSPLPSLRDLSSVTSEEMHMPAHQLSCGPVTLQDTSLTMLSADSMHPQ